MATLTITRPSSDYTNRDFDSWVEELRGRVAAAFPQWTDYTTPNFGNILLEMFAHTLDVASYYQDQQFLETRVVFAQLRSSMIALGKNLGFSLPGASVATVDVTFAFADGTARAAPLTVPKGTQVATPDGKVVFETVADATIPTGEIQVVGASVQNAAGESDTIVAPGTPGFSFSLSSIPYVDGSATATIAAQAWEQAPSNDFFTSGPTDRVFIVDVDDKGRATLVFGDGTNGAIPSGTGTVPYLTGGGAAGNVDANQVTLFVGGNRFPTTTGEQVTLTVRNPSGAGGGVDAMTVEEARVAIPAFVRTTGQRSVTSQDYEDNARKVRGVARAMLLTSDDVNTIDENTGKLYIVPVGGGTPSSGLKALVLSTILTTYPPPTTFTLSVEDPDLLVVSISARVYLARNVSQVDARAAVEASLTDFFSLVLENGAPNDQIDFGFRVRKEVMPPGSLAGVIPWSDLFNAVRDAATSNGTRVFREVDKNGLFPGADVSLADTQFPVLGSIALFDVDASAGF